MTELPSLGVMPDKIFKGAVNLSDPVPPLTIVPFRDAFTTPWTSDAHFAQYTAMGTGQDAFPRCNKAVLPRLRVSGADLLGTVLVLDYDNPKDENGEHRRWTRDTLSAWMEKLADLAATWPMAWQWSVLYTTRGGARLVYVLDEPIPVERTEGKHQWLCQEFCRRGMAIDCTVSDWTRVFRLPYVMRDGNPSWEDEIAEFIEQPQNRIDAEALPSALREKQINEYGEIRQFDEPRPDEEEAKALLKTYNSDTRAMRQSEWTTQAKRRLKGRECYACLFDHAPLATEGGRNATLFKYVGQAIGLLYYLEGTTAAHLYGLFLGPVEQLEPDSGTPDWKITLWDHIGRLWSLEDAKSEAEKAKAEASSEQSLELGDRVLSGMRTWCDDDTLHKGGPDSLLWASHRFIASVGPNYFVMGPNGYYDGACLLSSQVIPRIRELGMDRLIDIECPNGDGTGLKDVDLRSILKRHSTIVSDVAGLPEIDGGFIRNVGQVESVLVVPTFRRSRKLEPTYSPHVDAWLKVLFGPKHYDTGCKWIGWSLAFDEGPICSLSIEGGQGSGKKMIAVGLSECLHKPRLATEADLVGEHQYGLLQSPFLLVNEGWPQTIRGKHPADAFRTLVAGDPLQASQKYKAPVDARNPVRILFTANNLDVIRLLTGGKNLSPEDRGALAIRLMHLRIGNEASDWLRKMGGMAFTGRQGSRWISGDGNRSSDFVVAKHFLWLYQNRKGPVGSRFLVEGNSDNEVMFEMRTRSGKAPLVIEAIIHMLEGAKERDGLVISKGRLMVLSSEVLSYFRSQMSSLTKEQLSAQIISDVFRGLVIKDHPEAFELPERFKLGRRRWFELDCGLMLSVARRDGWTCPKLEQLAKTQQERMDDGSAPDDQPETTDPAPVPAGAAAAVRKLWDKLALRSRGNP